MTKLQQKIFTIDSRKEIEWMYKNMLEILWNYYGKVIYKATISIFFYQLNVLTTLTAVSNWHSHVLWIVTNGTSKHF